MEREAMLGAIEAAYAARVKGDVATMATYFTEDARFEIAGEKDLLERFPTGPGHAVSVIGSLIELVTFHERETLQTVVEDNHVALLHRIRMSLGGREPFDSLVYDLWEFGEDGRAVGLRQFIDTARFAVELAQAAGD